MAKIIPDPNRPMQEIPISAARDIANKYGYDQVLIYGRRVGEEPQPFGEHLTTYGVTKEHCGVMEKISATLQKFMGWNPK